MSDISSGKASPRTYEPALDGLRGIAILLVMCFHEPRVNEWVGFGWIGVDLFFVLSGYLITGVLLDGMTAAHRVRTFYVRRALRIVPLSYAAIAVAVYAMSHLTSPPDPRYRDLASNQVWLWTYTSNVRMARGMGSQFFFMGHFWSLAIEEQFYLLWPFVIWFASRSTARRVAWAVVIGAPMYRLLLVLTGDRLSMLYFFTPCRLDGLAVGSLIALSTRDPVETARSMRRAGIIAVAVLPLLLVWTKGSVVMVLPPIAVIGYSALAWAFGWLVSATVVRPHPIWRTPALVSAGRYSYGLYVWTPVVDQVVRTYWGTGYGGLRSASIVFAGSFVVAYLSYHGYETWFLRLKGRLAPR